MNSYSPIFYNKLISLRKQYIQAGHTYLPHFKFQVNWNFATSSGYMLQITVRFIHLVQLVTKPMFHKYGTEENPQFQKGLSAVKLYMSDRGVPGFWYLTSWQMVQNVGDSSITYWVPATGMGDWNCGSNSCCPRYLEVNQYMKHLYVPLCFSN